MSGSPLARPVLDASKDPIQVKNRRREYLEQHPPYFSLLEHELANPVLYERLIKRFQTTAEHEAEVKAKSYGHTLEADLVRGEDRLESLARGDGTSETTQDHTSYLPGSSQTHHPGYVEHSWEAETADKEHGSELWQAFLAERFIAGQDEDFDYRGLVDSNQDYDKLLLEAEEEAWFEDEEPSWADKGHSNEPCAEAMHREGETGIQDF